MCTLDVVIVVISGLGVNLKINVEPGLVEWFKWFNQYQTPIMTIEELQQFNLPVDISYKPVVSMHRTHHTEEQVTGEYQRGLLVAKTIGNQTGDKGEPAIISNKYTECGRLSDDL